MRKRFLVPWRQLLKSKISQKAPGSMSVFSAVCLFKGIAVYSRCITAGWHEKSVLFKHDLIVSLLCTQLWVHDEKTNVLYIDKWVFCQISGFIWMMVNVDSFKSVWMTPSFLRLLELKRVSERKPTLSSQEMLLKGLVLFLLFFAVKGSQSCPKVCSFWLAAIVFI